MKKPFNLAQANIARGHAALDDPIMSGFVEQLEYINSVAERAPGFVWRFQTEEGDATAVRVFGDPLLIFNMSVWESIESLYAYAFESDHRRPMKDRKSWFEKMDRPHSVMWWIPAGATPTPEEAERRLNQLATEGPSPNAFTFAKPFDQQGAPIRRSSPTTPDPHTRNPTAR